MNAGYVARDKLQGPARLQTEENLQKLFSWKTGEFAFEPGAVAIYENQRISFGEDYTDIVQRLARLEGSRFVEGELLSHIQGPSGPGRPSVLPAGNGPFSRGGPLNLALLSKFMEILRMRFDLVLVDAPPLDARPGTPALSTIVDGAVLVVKAGHITVKGLTRALESIRDTNILGAVLNQVKSKQSHYYYR